MKTLEDIKKELTSTLKEHEILLQAWNNVNRLYKKDGSSFSVLSKNFEKVPRTIPKHSISIVFLIFLLTGISFSVLLVLFKNLFIIHL